VGICVRRHSRLLRNSKEVCFLKWGSPISILILSVVAFQKIYNLGDPRVANVIVDGDLEVPDSNVILTRSKTRNCKFVRVKLDIWR
jgi:hypothetical protein